MDRAKFVLFGLPILLLCSDLTSLFRSPPPTVPSQKHHQHQPIPPETLEFPPTQSSGGYGVIGVGNTVKIDFCTSCSYRGTAVTVKKMLETSFTGLDVVLANYPPPLPKRVLSKIVPPVQMGVIVIVMAGEQIFPMLGFRAPPPWYYSLRANKFGSIAATWLLGNALQSLLQNTGAFEVYLNDELVFSKLKERRFPGEIELRDLIDKILANPQVQDKK